MIAKKTKTHASRHSGQAGEASATRNPGISKTAGYRLEFILRAYRRDGMRESGRAMLFQMRFVAILLTVLAAVPASAQLRKINIAYGDEPVSGRTDHCQGSRHIQKAQP